MFLILKKSFSTSVLKNTSSNLSNISLTGRDFIKPGNLTVDEIKSLLWTAIDLKQCKKQHYDRNINLENARVSLLLQKPIFKSQFSLRNAARLLNVNVNTVINNNEDFGENYEDLGNLLNCFSDIIFCENDDQDQIQKIADGATVPVIAIRTYEQSIIKVLADIMSIQEHYNHLKGLKFCYVGLHGPLINSYLSFLPRFGVNINYFCVDEGENYVTPCTLHHGLTLCQKTGAEIHEFTTKEDAIYRCDVVATSYHCHEKLKITRKHLKEAAINWTLFDTFPRGKEVESNLYRHKNCLVLKSMKNIQWIFASMLVRFLKNYCHVTEEPSFDDIEAGYCKSIKANKV